MTHDELIKASFSKRQTAHYIFGFINRKGFKAVYDNVSNEEKKKVLEDIAKQDLEKIKEWYGYHRHKQLETMTLSHLRDLSSILGIAYYGRKSKTQLIMEIERVYEQ